MTDRVQQPDLVEAISPGAASFRALMDNLGQCVYLMDATGRYTAVNTWFRQGLDRTAEEVLGHTVFDLWPPAVAEREAREHRRVLRGERIEQEEDRPRGRHSYQVRAVKAPVRDDLGEVVGVLGLFSTTGPARQWEQRPHAVERMGLCREAMVNPEPAILLVDNEPSILLLAQTILQRGGYRVVLADSGLRALEIYRQQPGEIGLVVLDQNMPGLSGLETMNELLVINPAVRILLMTGGHLPDLARGAGTPGWGFLEKPFQSKQLLKAVHDLLSELEA